MADSARLLTLTKHPGVKLSEPWKWVLEDDLTEGVPAERKLKSEIADSVVAIHDPPPSYMHNEKSNNSWIKCEVCQSWLSLKGREDHWMIQCRVCFANTPMTPAKSGFKYVRCLCNCIYSVEEDKETWLCVRPNCHRLLKLGPDHSIETTQLYSIRVCKCYQCQRESYRYNPSRLDILATCHTCNTLLSVKPTCTKVLIFVLTMIGLVSGIGGCALVADDFTRNTGWIAYGIPLYAVSMYFLVCARWIYKAARRSQVPQNYNWFDRSKDDFKLLYEKIYFPEGNAIQKKQTKVASASERASDIHTREYSQTYTPCANISNAWIKCEVCQSWMSLKGREDHRMIHCSVCFSNTPLRPAMPGFKYVRCLCNCIKTIPESWKRFLCTRPNCNTLVKLGPENSITTTKEYSCTRYKCGQCRSIFFSDSHCSRKIDVHCRNCTRIRPMYTNIRPFLFILIGLVCWAGGGVILVYSFCIERVFVHVGIALYFASVHFLTADNIYRKISHIVSHVSSGEKSIGI